jgi:hypothetical protein
MYSIELAHIYLDEYIAMEHVLGKEKFLEILKERNFEPIDYSVICMVDDYNALNNNLDLENFEEFINEALPKKARIVYESEMIFYAPITMSYLKRTDAKSYERYILKKNKYPCSLLALTFYLIRLGIIKNNLNIQSEEKIINILSDRFKNVEEIIIKLLKRSKIAGIEKNMETIYIKGTHGLYSPQS